MEIPYDIFSVSLMLRSCLNQTDVKLWIILVDNLHFNMLVNF